jgi:porphobilinogen synthase
MAYPTDRPRRLRKSASVRKLLRESRLHPHDLLAPLFVTEGRHVRQEIKSMPGQFRLSVDHIVEEAKELQALGVPGVLLFGVVAKKDLSGRAALNPKGPVPVAVQALKREVPGMTVFTDLCLCEYLEHGHCGLVDGEHVLNDATLPLLAKMALVHAQAGADFVSPSDMMDGRVGAIREALDSKNLSDTGIMAYSAKFASAFYGPFRDAAGSAPSFGDRKSYQMDPPNALEAMREMSLDAGEGADILMVKPGLPYLDILAEARASFDLPLAVYQVSGEYSMIEAAGQNGWIDRDRARDESLTAFRRAGADIVISYFAKEWAKDFKARGGLDA